MAGKNKLDSIEFTKYNFDSIINKSTLQLHQRHLDKELANSQGLTFEGAYKNVIKSLHESASELTGMRARKIIKKI